MTQTDYTFALQPGEKTTFNAGQYNPETQQPRYAMTISAPHHVRHQIESEQLLIRTGDGYLCTWQIKNRSVLARIHHHHSQWRALAISRTGLTMRWSERRAAVDKGGRIKYEG